MIKRYETNLRHSGRTFTCEMVEWDNGDYVTFSDYQKLEAENKRLRKQLRSKEHGNEG